MSKETFYDRLISERKELDGKIEKLETFIKGDVFAGLEKEDRTLLHEQLDSMRQYSYLLGKRFDRLKKPE